MSGVIKLRFVTSNDAISAAIRDSENFWLSHVECVTPKGKYLGAHYDGGIQAREPGYDKAKLKTEVFVNLPATDKEEADFYAYLESHIGEPYDFQSILCFVVHADMHAKDHAICSAAITEGLTTGANWFPAPLAEPSYKISPRDLFLILSAFVDVREKGVTLDAV